MKLQMRKVTIVVSQSYYSSNLGQNIQKVCSFHLKNQLHMQTSKQMYNGFF
jgi:hypothetical protein